MSVSSRAEDGRLQPTLVLRLTHPPPPCVLCSRKPTPVLGGGSARPFCSSGAESQRGGAAGSGAPGGPGGRGGGRGRTGEGALCAVLPEALGQAREGQDLGRASSEAPDGEERKQPAQLERRLTTTGRGWGRGEDSGCRVKPAQR